MKTLENLREETLDPQDWEAVRALGHRMIDDMMDYLQTVRERPVWQPVPDEVKAALRRPLPQEPQPLEAVYQAFREDVLPYPLGNIHPRFWGWVIGTGSATGALAELLAATMNPNSGGADHVANYVEAQVLDWCKEMVGFTPDAGGLLVSGASMANLVGLASARSARAGFDVRQRGLYGAPHRLVFYASSEAHSCIKKAVEVMGLGSDGLRLIPVDADYRMDMSVLEQSIAADRAAGLHPVGVVGTAGTVNTGAFDDLGALADLCQREGLWFHVDGAFGALVALSEELRPLAAGMERADSLAFDLHKWMYMPYEIACILVRDPADQRRAFALSPDYLKHSERGMASGELWYSELGLQLSRSFRALKAWMLLQEHGIRKYARLIEQNVAQARYLAQRVQSEPELELMAPVPLNIVCFRYRFSTTSEEIANSLNEELLTQLHESGVAAPSYTRVNGCYVLRAAITNHRSRREDFDLLVEKVLELGRALQAG